MSLIERVARAMYEDDNGQLWETSSFRKEYIRNARVAIEAMRPDVEKGASAAETYVCFYIDAALKEGVT